MESRHVIGLFMLMLVFSGVFFALGYVMGRNQYDGQVRAATTPPRVTPDPVVSPKSELSASAKHAKNSASASNTTTAGSGWGSSSSSSSNSGSATSVVDAPSDESAPPSSDWGFYNAGKGAPDDRLRPAPANATPSIVGPSQVPAVANNKNAAHTANVSAKTSNATTAPGTVAVPSGAFVLQVAALRQAVDANAVAASLRAKKFPAFVVNPTTDKYYHVQVGPYHDVKSANAAKKGLESAGFKAIVKH